MAKRLTKKRTRTPEQEGPLKMVRRYHAVQRMRKGLGNQIGAMLRQELIPVEEHDQMIAEHVKPWEKVEREIIRDAAKYLKGMPIWEEWLKHVRGIAENLAVQFVAMIQPISDFPNVAKLWSYAGYRVEDGEAVRRRAGVQSNWSDELKVAGFNAGECFIRSGGAYRELYDRYKARDREKHPEKVATKRKSKKGEAVYNYTDMHIHNRARRYVIKMFMSHLWQVWRELEELPTPGPYPIEYLGHTTVLSPWAFVEDSASQAAGETQDKLASHGRSENHTTIASHARGETQLVTAS